MWQWLLLWLYQYWWRRPGGVSVQPLTEQVTTMADSGVLPHGRVTYTGGTRHEQNIVCYYVRFWG